MSHVKVSTTPAAVADASDIAETLNAQVVVFDTDPPQTTFIQTNQPQNIRAFSGFEATLGLDYVINLEMMAGMHFVDPPVLWLQSDGSYSDKAPPGFTVLFDPNEPTKLSILDQFQQQENAGIFIFQLQVADNNGVRRLLDPTIVNRPIVNGAIKSSAG